MAEEGAGPQIAQETRRAAAALGALSLLFLWSFGLSLAVLRGPLSVEAFASGLARFPRALVIALACAMTAPWIALAFRERRSPIERGVAVLSIAFAVVVGWASSSTPRFAFDEWERRFSAVSAGVPWTALGITIVAAVFAASAGLAAWRYMLARGGNTSSRLLAGAIAFGVVVFAIPAAASVYLATGTRLLPIGEPDGLWAPAFAASACPPTSPPTAPPPATSAR